METPKKDDIDRRIRINCAASNLMARPPAIKARAFNRMRWPVLVLVLLVAVALVRRHVEACMVRGLNWKNARGPWLSLRGALS